MTAITYHCTPAGMVPLARFGKDYEREFKVGKFYTLEQQTERSKGAHGLYFKAVYIAWENLPEFGPSWKTADHYRQHCLIEARFHHERRTPYNTAADAWKAVADLKALPTYSECEVDGSTLIMRWAKTQKYKKNDPDGMDKKDFDASMAAVLEIAAGNIDLTVEQLVDEAKKQMVRMRKT